MALTVAWDLSTHTRTCCTGLALASPGPSTRAPFVAALESRQSVVRSQHSWGSFAAGSTTRPRRGYLKAGLGAHLNKLGSEEFSKNGVNGSVGSAAGGRLPVDTHAHVLHWSGPRKP